MSSDTLATGSRQSPTWDVSARQLGSILIGHISSGKMPQWDKGRLSPIHLQVSICAAGTALLPLRLLLAPPALGILPCPRQQTPTLHRAQSVASNCPVFEYGLLFLISLGISFLFRKMGTVGVSVS